MKIVVAVAVAFVQTLCINALVPQRMMNSVLKSRRAAPPPLMASCALGIDVGTGSARCGVFTLDGKLLGSKSIDIKMFQPEGMPDL
jgi:hypothetical protein